VRTMNGGPQDEGRLWPTLIVFAVVMAAVFAVQWILGQSPPARALAWSEFLAQVDSGNVASVTVTGDRVRGRLRRVPEGETTEFTTVRVDPSLAERLAAHGVEMTGVPESVGMRGLAPLLLPLLFLFGIWMLVLRRIGRQGAGSFMAVGRSRARVYVEQRTGVTFDDVAGVDEAKEELREVVAFLRDPESLGRLGAHIPKGVLLVGPPGTGKTLLARAVAGEADAPFFSINGSEFVELFVGVGAARVRDLFEQARGRAPCIVFIDEIDALGKARGITALGGGADEKEQTLNQLLAEMDGFSPSDRVILLAATNRPEILDPALLRAGRFDRQVLVDRPDRVGRVQILKVHVRNVRVAPDLELDEVAALTPGFTGADLANLVNEAALTATRRGADAIRLEDFTVALERIVAGLEKRTRVLIPRERRTVAYHELGHAFVARAIPGADPVQKVSIIPRGIAGLGYTLQRPAEDRYLLTRTELETKLAVLLGGRAAEWLVFGELSTGAADDLARASELARDMVARYGMDETIGPVVHDGVRAAHLGHVGGAAGEGPPTSEATAREIEVAVRMLLENAFARALRIVERDRALLERTAELLLERESLTPAELPEIPPEPDTVPAEVRPLRLARPAGPRYAADPRARG
jgi:cell division protease FtsH